MDYLILGQRDINWLQMVVLGVIIAGSVLGPVAKKLIEKFSPVKEQEPGTGRPKQRGQGAPSPPRVPPAHPVARPLPPQLGPQRPAARPVARGHVPPPPVEQFELEVVLPPVTPHPRTAPRRPAAQQPPTRPPQVPTAAPPPRPRREPAQRSATKPERGRRIARKPSETPYDGVEARLGHLEPTVADRLGHLESALEDETVEVEAAVEDRLGHMDSDLDVVDPTSARSRRRTGLLARRPTRRALQHAVLMREILGPPLALRTPDEPF